MGPHLFRSSGKIKYRTISREISKYIHKDISAKTIRQKFLDYFIKEQGHAFVRSSPVVPFCDPSVPFVNAGMNQFKGIFLGVQTPHFSKVANSQKCIRVGGKHNDLNVVGKDGYHHTFFEMLGNWSFGDYFKEEACKMSWELLTQVYKIPPARLYVTYFGGDDKLGLSSDLETREIWKSLGVKESRILPFGSKDNFWEMGLSGPCGPCTEIHFDHTGVVNRAQFVNRDLHDLTEIWNLVFVQYNRLPDSSLALLPQRHVDTGLGLERVCCALQGKLSSYETDLFDYLMNAIQKNCSNVPSYSGKFGENDWNDVDTSYRILADHMRMLTVSLADGVIPEQNQKLRRIIRKCFVLSETVFGKSTGLVKELSNYVVENLGDVYPEMEKNINQIHQILDYEEEIFSSIRSAAKKDWTKLGQSIKDLPEVDHIDITPSFIKAFKELHSARPAEIDEDWSYRLYDTHGLDGDAIEQLAQVLNIKFTPSTFETKMEKVKLKSKTNRQIFLDKMVSLIAENGLKKTDDSGKYSYTKASSDYVFPDESCRVLQIIAKDKSVLEAKGPCSLILDRTNMYCEAGGQESDKGVVNFKNALFKVDSLTNINGIIVHRGHVEGGSVKINSEGSVSIDESSRLGSMRNHTCAHLMNEAIRKIKRATCQKSSKVSPLFLNLDVSVFGPKLNVSDVVDVENIVNAVIKDKVDVRVSITDSQGLYSYDDITLIPGEVYPDNNVRIIEVEGSSGFVSREPCCGTHVLNTGDIEEFCIVGLKSLGRSSTSLHAVTGSRAKLARKNAEELAEDIAVFKKSVSEHLDTPDMLDMGVLSLKQRLNFDATDDSILPYVYRHQALEELNEISRQIKEKSNVDLKKFLDMEMYDALERKVLRTKSNKKYMVHYLRSSMMFESVPLHKATAMCPDIPVIIIAYSDSVVKARCCVPEEFHTENFTAEKWLEEAVASVFKGNTSPERLQNGVYTCNMKGKKVHLQDWHHLLAESIEGAKNYINDNI